MAHLAVEACRRETVSSQQQLATQYGEYHSPHLPELQRPGRVLRDVPERSRVPPARKKVDYIAILRLGTRHPFLSHREVLALTVGKGTEADKFARGRKALLDRHARAWALRYLDGLKTNRTPSVLPSSFRGRARSCHR